MMTLAQVGSALVIMRVNSVRTAMGKSQTVHTIIHRHTILMSAKRTHNVRVVGVAQNALGNLYVQIGVATDAASVSAFTNFNLLTRYQSKECFSDIGTDGLVVT